MFLPNPYPEYSSYKQRRARPKTHTTYYYYFLAIRQLQMNPPINILLSFTMLMVLIHTYTSVSAAFAATLIAARPKMHGERSGG